MPYIFVGFFLSLNMEKKLKFANNTGIGPDEGFLITIIKI